LPTVTASLAAFRRKRGGTGENYRCAVSDPLCVLMNGYLQFGEDGPGFVRALRGNSFHTELSDAIIETTSAQIHENRIRLSRRRAQYLIPQFPGLFPTVHTVEANPISKFLQEVNRGLASLGRWDRLGVLSYKDHSPMTNRVTYAPQDFQKMCKQAERDHESKKLVALMDRVKKQIAERKNPDFKVKASRPEMEPVGSGASRLPSRTVPFER
jgi:hypothetical protein